MLGSEGPFQNVMLCDGATSRERLDAFRCPCEKYTRDFGEEPTVKLPSGFRSMIKMNPVKTGVAPEDQEIVRGAKWSPVLCRRRNIWKSEKKS